MNCAICPDGTQCPFVSLFLDVLSFQLITSSRCLIKAHNTGSLASLTRYSMTFFGRRLLGWLKVVRSGLFFAQNYYKWSIFIPISSCFANYVFSLRSIVENTYNKPVIVANLHKILVDWWILNIHTSVLTQIPTQITNFKPLLHSSSATAPSRTTHILLADGMAFWPFLPLHHSDVFRSVSSSTKNRHKLSGQPYTYVKVSNI